MTKVAETHSKEPSAKVYHNNGACTTRNNIEKKNIASGKGSKKELCEFCKSLNRQGK